MRVSIFGLGYVGAVAAGCLARRGHNIIGVDVHSQKVEALNRGVAPIFEPGLELLLRSAQSKGLLRATENASEAISESDLSIVCVGTPSTEKGTLDLSFIRTVLRQIAVALAERRKRHSIIVRSTILPGSTEQLVKEIFGTLPSESQPEVIYHPEFLREGSAVEDFDNPSIMVVGTRQAMKPSELAAKIIGESTQVVAWRTAEMLKFACNAFHAAKVVFGNEMGRLCKTLGIDAQSVMALLCQDTKLNLSSYYLSPGNPFGGSCLRSEE